MMVDGPKERSPRWVPYGVPSELPEPKIAIPQGIKTPSLERKSTVPRRQSAVYNPQGKIYPSEFSSKVFFVQWLFP